MVTKLLILHNNQVTHPPSQPSHPPSITTKPPTLHHNQATHPPSQPSHPPSITTKLTTRSSTVTPGQPSHRHSVTRKSPTVPAWQESYSLHDNWTTKWHNSSHYNQTTHAVTSMLTKPPALTPVQLSYSMTPTITSWRPSYPHISHRVSPLKTKPLTTWQPSHPLNQATHSLHGGQATNNHYVATHTFWQLSHLSSPWQPIQ